jgi:hypothetical protein
MQEVTKLHAQEVEVYPEVKRTLKVSAKQLWRSCLV